LKSADVIDLTPATVAVDTESPADDGKKRVKKRSKKKSILPAESRAPDAPDIIEAPQDQPEQPEEQNNDTIDIGTADESQLPGDEQDQQDTTEFKMSC